MSTRARADVCVHTKTSFFHADIAYAQVLKDLAQSSQIRPSLFRRAHVWLTYDLDQRNAGSIQIDRRCARIPVMKRLASVLFHMDSRDADRLLSLTNID